MGSLIRRLESKVPAAVASKDFLSLSSSAYTTPTVRKIVSPELPRSSSGAVYEIVTVCERLVSTESVLYMIISESNERSVAIAPTSLKVDPTAIVTDSPPSSDNLGPIVSTSTYESSVIS